MTLPSRGDVGLDRSEVQPRYGASGEPLVWVNGERSASVSVHDRGVTLADGVFETWLPFAHDDQVVHSSAFGPSLKLPLSQPEQR